MARKRSAEDLSVDELRHLLIEKRRLERQDRLESYRRTGRVVNVGPDPAATAVEAAPLSYATDDLAGEARVEPRRRRRRQAIDGVLFLIEIAAIAGLLFVFFNGFNLLRDLNREVAAALEQPTLTPTPLIMAVVLPSGHIPPGQPGAGQPDESEIPEYLQPMVQSLANLPVPTAGPEQASRIQIAAINVDAPVVQGDGAEQLKKGVGQHLGTPDPGQAGNIVLSAHNDVFGEIFRDLDRLKVGDTIVLFTSQRQYIYAVTDSRVVDRTTVEVMNPTETPTVTLISCYPYMVDKQRIVITAVLQTTS